MHEAFPSATMYCSPSVPEKDPNGSWGVVVKELIQVSNDVLLFCISDMTPFREVVALHIPSRTLLVADLAGNMTPKTLEHAGIGAKIFCRLVRGFGAMENGMHVMLIMWRFCHKARQQYEELYSMPWENVVPCHGDVLQKNGKLAFRGGVYRFICSPSKQLALRMMPYFAALAFLVSLSLYISA
ncbi:hypothetical protein FGB62_182g134 [Gracilaria domingensis]|nr:hypothetical protein FGB62_182g134 [Gracilaria domingensis]